MKKVRYAVVGAGWISQEAFMPSIEQTGNSQIAAIVSGTPDKAKKLAEFYGIKQVVGYDGYDALLQSKAVDAVYIALPNSQHADFAIRAAKAGVHAIVEKPLATTVAECEAMIAAAKAAGTWLMTAYRLHNEPANVEALNLIANGAIGKPRLFTSLFSFQSGPVNHRLLAEHWGGPLQDIGVYCLNAARHVFRAEPVEAMAMTARPKDDPRFGQVEAAITATLRFPGEGLATFTVSFGAGDSDMWQVIGSTGSLEVAPAFRFDLTQRMRLTAGGKVTDTIYPRVDHFSGQAAYFSDCILSGTRPEADGEEGLADVRAMRAIEEAARTGRSQPISSPPRSVWPDPSMVRKFPPTARRLLV